jgi:hypothetical protein
LILPRDTQPRTSSSYRGGLRCCHVSRGPGPRLLAELRSGAATCSLTQDITSLLRWAPALPHVSWLRALPPKEESSGAATCSSAPDLTSLSRCALVLPRGPDLASTRGELLHCHVFLSSGHRLPAEVGSGAATWPRPRLPKRRTPALPRVPQLRTSPSYQGGLRCDHVAPASPP